MVVKWAHFLCAEVRCLPGVPGRRRMTTALHTFPPALRPPGQSARPLEANETWGWNPGLGSHLGHLDILSLGSLVTIFMDTPTPSALFDIRG